MMIFYVRSDIQQNATGMSNETHFITAKIIYQLLCIKNVSFFIRDYHGVMCISIEIISVLLDTIFVGKYV